ncbi:nitroreductase family protein [Schleiferilactobacillus harbinensis]|uniref:nitroreductase family protein n=1 Tax=Schleiferilactobacillus harbinensis TaxID=304207 RepID=UPI0026717C74|nr:nitroreductase family protein [Schleiferilactobacillus harbinensis]
MTELPVTPLTKNDFAQNVFGRRSIRKFDSDFKITRAEMQEILTQAGRAPSSMNLQPWRFVVVDSTAGKTKLHDLVMTNTPQNDTASAMIIVFGVDHPERDDAKIYDAAVAAGTMTPATRDEEVAEIDAYYHTMGDLAREKTISLDAGLVTMQLALVARAHGYEPASSAASTGRGLNRPLPRTRSCTQKSLWPLVKLPRTVMKVSGCRWRIRRRLRN